MSEHQPLAETLRLTAEIISAYVANASIAAQDVPGLVRKVYRTLSTVGQPQSEAAVPGKPVPAVPVKKSVFPDYIVCLEDGKKLKMLKRHLKTSYNMTPAEYRQKWGLSREYPMVAPSYAARRSDLAKSIGLGRSREAGPVITKVPAGKSGLRRRQKGSEGVAGHPEAGE